MRALRYHRCVQAPGTAFGDRPELERFNAWTHGLGAVLALFGLLALMARSMGEGEPARVASLAVYGISLVTLFTASAAYHGSRGRVRADSERAGRTRGSAPAHLFRRDLAPHFSEVKREVEPPRFDRR